MSIQSKVQQIVGLAMEISESGIADVNAHYYGGLHTLDVYIYLSDSDYGSQPISDPQFLYTQADKARSEQQIIADLDAVIAELNELKAQRKEK